MTKDYTLTDISPPTKPSPPAAAQIAGGIPIPPIRRLQVFSPEEWEEFTEEWLSYLKSKGEYHSIRRFSGPGDLGLDVIAFTAEDGFRRTGTAINANVMTTHLRRKTSASKSLR